MKNKDGVEWFKKKEPSSAWAYRFAFWGLTHLPRWFMNFIFWLSALFYFLFNRRGRSEAARYQKTFKKFYPELKILPFRQLASFAVAIAQKIDCWTNPIPFENIHFNNDDAFDLIDRLNNKQGAFLFISHLGNFEALRSLANVNEIGVKEKVPFAVISDFDVSSNFSKVLQELAPEFAKNMVNDNSITPATVEKLMDTIAQGGIVVCAGDRLSKNTSNKIITQDFMKKPAPFSYGAFFLAALLEAPVYFIFGCNKKDLVMSREFEMHVRRAKTQTAGPRKEREERIKNLCAEYAATLEEFCKIYPYQWYNFFDFWAFPSKESDAQANGVEDGKQK